MVSWTQAIFTCLVSRKFASSEDEFLIPLQFQERIPIGEGEDVEGAADDVVVDRGPGFGWTFPMKRRMRRSWRERDFRGCRLTLPGDEAGHIARLKKDGRVWETGCWKFDCSLCPARRKSGGFVPSATIEAAVEDEAVEDEDVVPTFC